MAATRNSRRAFARTTASRRAPALADQKPLFRGTDHGHPIRLRPDDFGARQQGGGWGPSAEAFLRLNEPALSLLDVRAELRSSNTGPQVVLLPGARAGAIPLRSGITAHVVGGLVIRPRFGWAGVGRVLSQIGWHAAPELVDLPMVPGSGREVPPWVLAGPAIARLAELLRSVTRGYRDAEELLSRPRGRILWPDYKRELVRGRWHQIPCRFPDLTGDLRLRRHAKWTLERLHRDLVAVGGRDPIAVLIGAIAARLLGGLADVQPLLPTPGELRRALGGNALLADAVRRGVEAMAWIVEERGLGGGREMDGLAWYLSLDSLWESFVESVLRREAVLVGAELRCARLRETTFPIEWQSGSVRSLGMLAPDFVFRRRGSVTVIDAKYKAHLAEIDEVGWRTMTDDLRDSHRADVHQALAYAALFDADEVTTRLVYPLRVDTWRALSANGRDLARAELVQGGRKLRLELQGLPFGMSGVTSKG